MVIAWPAMPSSPSDRRGSATDRLDSPKRLRDYNPREPFPIGAAQVGPSAPIRLLTAVSLPIFLLFLK